MADDQDANPEAEVDIHFQPVIQLQPVEVNLMEDDEDEVFKIRAKLYRFDKLAEPPEWKERGLGDMRLLKHKETDHVRLVMRREKTLKICCNHYLTSAMNLQPHSNSDRAFVWTTLADIADEEPKHELLAIKFRDAENASKFKSKFEELQKLLSASGTSVNNGAKSKPSDGESEVINKLTTLSVTETEKAKNSGDQNKENENKSEAKSSEES